MKTEQRHKKYKIQVRDKASGMVLKTIERTLRAEQIGNFNPMFCRYAGNKRCLVNSDKGDLSDPFRREDSYADALYIEVVAAPEAIQAALVSKAKEMALTEINSTREQIGRPPLKKLEKLWWDIHGPEMIEKARKEFEK